MEENFLRMHPRLFLKPLLGLLFFASVFIVTAPKVFAIVEPSGYWKLDETSPSSTVSDSSVNENNGTVLGSPTPSSSYPSLKNISDTESLSFNSGTSDNVSIPDSASLDMSSSFSISFWIKPSAWNDGQSRGIISKYSSGEGKGYIIYDDGSSGCSGGAAPCGPLLNFRGMGASSNYEYLNSASVVNVGTWQQWTATYDAVGHVFSWYKNGALDAQYNGVNFGDLTNTSPMYLGYSEPWNGYFSGNLDEVRVYQSVLSSDDIAYISATSALGYESSNSAVTPDSPGTEASTANIGAVDNSYMTTALSHTEGGYDSQVFKFTPDVTNFVIPEFTALWSGHGDASSDKAVTLSIWNFLSSAWETIQSQTGCTGSPSDCTLTGSRTGSNYVSNNTVWLWAKADKHVFPVNISGVADNNGLLPILWNTDGSSDTQVFWDTVSHAGGITSDYAFSSDDSTLVTSHSTSPGFLDSTSKRYYGISASADGTIIAGIANGGDVWVSNTSGVSWNDVSVSIGTKQWVSVGISADGLKIYALETGGDVWNGVSSDGGASYSWTNLSTNSTGYPGTGTFSWNSTISTSADGSNIEATLYNNDIYTAHTADNGVSWVWTPQTAPGVGHWSSVVFDSSNTNPEIFAIMTGGDVWNGVSSDGGASYSWTNLSTNSTGYPGTGTFSWNSTISTSADGSKIVVASGSGDIYTALTADGGTSWTWTDQTNAPNTYWWSVAINADGTKIVAGPENGYIQIGTYDSGSSTWTWAPTGGHSNWEYWKVALDSTGTKFFAGGHGALWTYTNGDASWIDRTGTTYYYRVKSCNSDGACATSSEHSLVYSISSSCPFIFTYDGTKYNFIIDASSSSTLGSGTNMTQWKKTPFYAQTIYPDPESYVKIPNGDLSPRTDNSGTYYDVKTTFELNEVNYLDRAGLEVIDHSPSVDVFPDYRYNAQIHTIAKNAPAPLWVKDQTGKDVTSLVANNDNIYWHSASGSAPSYLDMRLLDGVNTPSNLKLVIKKGTEGIFRGNRQFDILQYKNSNGVFVNVPDNLNPFVAHRSVGGSVTPLFDNSYGTDTKVIDLSGLSIKDNEVRLVLTNRQLQTDVDWLAVDTSPDDSVTTTSLSPYYADLHFRGVSKQVPTNPSDPAMQYMTQPDYSNLDRTIGEGNILSGNATRYGDVLPLLSTVDDKFVIATQGDELSLKYSVPTQAGGTVRDFIYDTWDYHKSYHNGTGDTILPLPFNEMTQYPYHTNIENYPSDSDHSEYQSTYNTRAINWGTNESVPGVHHSLNTDQMTLTVSEVGDTTPPSVPVASPTSGTYTSPQSVAMTSDGSDSIRYSTSDTPADCSSGELYSGEVLVSSSETIYVRACKSSNRTSAIASFPFVLAHRGSAHVFTSNTPSQIAPPQLQVNPSVVTSVNVPVAGDMHIPITSAGLPANFQFKKDLRPSMTKNDVKNLQIFLNNNGFPVSKIGVGSKGKENNYFGLKTKLALIKFQESRALDILVPQGFKKGTGILGPYSRKVINAWLASSSH